MANLTISMGILMDLYGTHIEIPYQAKNKSTMIYVLTCTQTSIQTLLENTV